MGLSESEHPTYTDAVLLLLTKDEILILTLFVLVTKEKYWLTTFEDVGAADA
jgi:hypothetical protein